MSAELEDQRSGERLVAFRLGREIFAIDILFIQEVLHLRKVTSIPHAPSFIQGVIDVRGRVVPVVDLKRRLGLQVSDGHGGRIIILSLGDRLLGLRVDSVHKVIDLPRGCREELPDAVVENRKTTCLASLAKSEAEGIVVIIDPERILTGQEEQAWEQFESAQLRRTPRKKGVS